MKLTLDRIDSLKCPEGKRDVLVFDDKQRGLGVRVTASGGKTYLAQYSFHGQKHRVPLGSCSAVSLAKARDAVRAIMGDVAKDVDPAAERKKAKAQEALTLSALLTDWQALHLAGKRPRYASEAVRAVRNAFSRYLDLPAADLDRAIVVKTIDAMARKGSAAMAARTTAYGKASYGWAVKRGALSINPFLNLPVAPTTKRERVLSDDELGAIWRATAGTGCCQRASIVRRTFERLLACGEGPTVLHLSPRRRGVLESDFEAWLRSRRRAAPGDAASSAEGR